MKTDGIVIAMLAVAMYGCSRPNSDRIVAPMRSCGSTDMAASENVFADPERGCVSLAKKGHAFFRESLGDPAHWLKPKVHGGRLTVAMGVMAPDGSKCLEVKGSSAKPCDTAWSIVSKRHPILPQSEEFALKMLVSASFGAATTRGQGRDWRQDVAWFDGKGELIRRSGFEYAIPMAGWTVVRGSGKIPPEARFFEVRLGFDEPNVLPGDYVHFKDLELGFVLPTSREYERRGTFTSYPVPAGKISWTGDTPEGTKISIAAEPAGEGLIRYRVLLEGDGAATPVLRSVTVGNRVENFFLERFDRIAPYVRLVNAAEPIRDARDYRPVLEITDKSPVDWSVLSVQLDGSEATAEFRREGNRLSYVGARRTWSPGLHKIVIHIADANGNAHDAQKRFYIGGAPTTPRVSVRNDGMTLIDGKPFFPIGIYGVKPCRENGMSWDAAMSELGEMGMNLVQSYAPQKADFLTAAAKAGLKVVSKPRMPEDSCFESFKVRPEIIAWYLGDDTSEHCTAMELRDRNDAMHAADGTRLTCQADGVHENYRDYAYGTDVFIPEIYPIRLGTVQEHEACASSVLSTMRRIDTLVRTEKMAPRSVWALLDHFSGWGHVRFPTREELFASSYAALVGGADGIMWYTYSGWDAKLPASKQTRFGARDIPERWAEMKELVGQIRYLSPALVERTPQDQPEVQIVSGPKEDVGGNCSVNALLKRAGGKTVVMAVNSAVKPVRARLSFAAGPKGRVLWENRNVVRERGVLEDDFPPLSVHVYEF